MTISTFEGIIKNGQIRLRNNVTLPENSRVYIIIPDFEATPKARVSSPRLVHPEQAADFAKKIVEVSADAEL